MAVSYPDTPGVSRYFDISICIAHHYRIHLKVYIKIHKIFNTNKSHVMYLFFTLLFMFSVFIVKWKYASASHQVSTNQQNIHLLLHTKNTHIVTNTVLREGCIMGFNLLTLSQNIKFQDKCLQHTYI